MHHTQASFIPQNLANEVKSGRIVERFFKGREGQVIDQAMINDLTHKLVHAAFANRYAENRLTGEWIVYEEGHLGNYYLTLVEHKEGDATIYEREMNYRDLDHQLENIAMLSSPTER